MCGGTISKGPLESGPRRENLPAAPPPGGAMGLIPNCCAPEVKWSIKGPPTACGANLGPLPGRGGGPLCITTAFCF